MADTQALTLDDVKETYMIGGEGADFKRVFYQRGKDFDAWVESIRADEREKSAARAQRWLSNAQNFPFAFVSGSFMIERNAVANTVPDAIRNQTEPGA